MEPPPKRRIEGWEEEGGNRPLKQRQYNLHKISEIFCVCERVCKVSVLLLYMSAVDRNQFLKKIKLQLSLSICQGVFSWLRLIEEGGFHYTEI